MRSRIRFLLLTIAISFVTAVGRIDAQLAPMVLTREDGIATPMPAARQGFSLFAEEDLAGTSLRLTGLYRYAFFNAGGLCSFGSTAGDLFNSSCGQGGGSSNYFHVQSAWGVGIDTYRKIREFHPGISNMLSPIGYSAPYRLTSVSPIVTRIGPADGQIGEFFSGVTAANGEGCRDMSGPQGAGMPPNFTLLASSDCPVTWAGDTWEGIREIPDSVWIRRFNANPSAFRWDDWRIPRSEVGDTPPLGDNAAFGSFSDYPREVVQSYGGVTPHSAGPPRQRGFPLGLEVRADAFKFDRPSLRDGVFIRWLVINNSAKVWGRGIDYDSIAFGVDPGYSTGGPRPAVNNIMELGVHTAMSGNLSGRCNNTTYPRRVPPGAVQGCDGTSIGFPFIMFLKSPLGDLRNKMFTMTNPDGTPRFPSFHKPDHQEADDTITFNRYFQGGFGSGQLRYQSRSDRAWYGAMAGREADALDGRSSTDFTPFEIWSDFLYEGTTGTNAPENARYNKSVPSAIPGYGKWDWNDDGIPDTIKVPECGQFGCARPFADTIAGGFTSDNGENIGSFLGVSEFSLKAGDTTAFIFYMGYVPGRDTTLFLRAISNVTEAYLKNYTVAAPYPVPVITPQNVMLTPAAFRDSASSAQDVNVRIQLQMAPQRDDPYIRSILDRIQSPEGDNLRRLNPALVAEVTRRMRQNLAEIMIFKSCDDGVTWTHTVCTQNPDASRARDDQGNPEGTGWLPRFRISPADTGANNGVLPTYVFSENVQGGREYLYSIVTKTRSLQDIRVLLSQTIDASGNVITSRSGTLSDALGVDIDSILSPLRTSGNSTVKVYAPLSLPAGTIHARLDTSTVQGNATNRVRAIAGSNSASGTYRMRFGNRFIVQRSVNVTTNVTTTSVIRESIYQRGTLSTLTGATINFVAAADTFVGTAPLAYSTGGNAANTQQLSTTPRAGLSTPQTQVFLDTISKAGYVLADPSGAPLYLAVGNTFLPGGNAGIIQSTTVFEGSPSNPGFVATINPETAPNSPRMSVLLRPSGDTANAVVVNDNAVVYQAIGSNLFDLSTNAFQTRGYTPGGIWKLEWSGDAFGPGAPFAWDTPAALQARVTASLASRPVAQTASIDASLRTLPNFPTGLVGVRTGVIAARLPFRVVDEQGQQAEVLFQARHVFGNAADSVVKNSILLGTNADTVRVSIPADVWMPGDTVFVVQRRLVDSTITISGTATTVLRDTMVNGRLQRLPIQVSRDVVTLRLRMACNGNTTPTRATCNPIRLADRGSTGYLPIERHSTTVIHLNRQFDQNSEVAITAIPVQTNARPLTKADMNRIHVVPNPYIVQSDFDIIGANRQRIDARVRFVNVPDEGVLRIYSISGQLMQQLSWTPSDLIASGENSAHGDLPYDLRSRYGWDLVPGLYMYVLTPRGANAGAPTARGKFVVIR